MCTVHLHLDQLDMEYLSLDMEHLEHLAVGMELLLTRAQCSRNELAMLDEHVAILLVVMFTYGIQ